MTFTFIVEGRAPFTVEAARPVDAYSLANRHFGSLPQGAWMETGRNGDAFRWALGSFFD